MATISKEGGQLKIVNGGKIFTIPIDDVIIESLASDNILFKQCNSPIIQLVRSDISSPSSSSMEDLIDQIGVLVQDSSSTQAEVLVVAVSDETSDLTTGTGKVAFRMPYAMTLTEVRASVTTAPTSANLVCDINKSGTSILSTKLSIDATEKTSTTATTEAVISDSALADDSEITIDIDQVGSSVAGTGLKVYLIGNRA